MTVANTIEAALREHGVAYQTVRHPRTFSSRDSAAAAHVADQHVAKAVILRDDAGFVMVVIPASHHVRLHTVQEELDRPLGLASEAEISRLFGDCQPGAVPPLGPSYGLNTLLDEALRTLPVVYFEAGDHEALVRINGDDFRALLKGARHGFYSHAG